ncbi:hypothetical protein CVT26_004242 [Gymnopilus dilepis]|uniref:BAG domain-containing protein n=1 Tax=Gymnopilus dilepis TaxID=231916 RepID=A0A409W706_9AGAR|nr:hypothetical protein CVT26_004242 [Gymnopilus dilepis]
MYGNPWYNNYNSYPSNASYNPYLHPSYQQPSPYGPVPARGYYDADRARALAEQRARRAQYLPDEVSDEEDNWQYNQLDPRERAYLNAKKRQEMLEQQQRQRALQEQQRLQALEQRRREEEARLRMQEEQRNHARLQREQEAQRVCNIPDSYDFDAEHKPQEKRFSRSPMPPRDRSTSRGPTINTHVRSPSSVRTDHLHPQSAAPHTPRSPSQASPRNPGPNVRPPSPPKPQVHYTEEHEKAATVIQQRYRIHAASKKLDSISAQFQELKSKFTYPSSIDFQKPGESEETVNVPATRAPSDFDDDSEEPMEVDGPQGKLAYTSKNYPLHQYADSMDKLLMKLDGIESWGDKGLRLKRRQYVKEIEKEEQKLERYWKQAWVDYLASQSKSQKQETSASTSQEANGFVPEVQETPDTLVDEEVQTDMDIDEKHHSEVLKQTEEVQTEMSDGVQAEEIQTEVDDEHREERKGRDHKPIVRFVKEELEEAFKENSKKRAPSLKRHITT